MRDFWTNKKILVTGGNGFIGSHIVDRLINTRDVSPNNIIIPHHKTCDLKVNSNCQEILEGVDIVIHAAADVGGLEYSRENPAKQYYECSIVDLNMIEAAKNYGVDKFIFVSCSTSYPQYADSPLSEEAVFLGEPTMSHYGHGWAKRNEIILTKIYYQQYQLNTGAVIANNTFGPKDNFDPRSSHVIPALIRKFMTEKKVSIWGDGSQIRDFIYVEDLAEGILLAAEKLPPGEFVNLGSGKGVTIRELVYLISKLTNFEGPIAFDKSKPIGEKIRVVNIEKAIRMIGFIPKFSLEEGLKRTITWYKSYILNNN